MFLIQVVRNELSKSRQRPPLPLMMRAVSRLIQGRSMLLVRKVPVGEQIEQGRRVLISGRLSDLGKEIHISS